MFVVFCDIYEVWIDEVAGFVNELCVDCDCFVEYQDCYWDCEQELFICCVEGLVIGGDCLLLCEGFVDEE